MFKQSLSNTVLKFGVFTLINLIMFDAAFAQNSLVGDGFGGRLWYKPCNYSVGSYSGYTTCGEEKQLFAWGANNHHQLGNGSSDTIGSPIPVKCINMTNVKFYTAGYVMGAIKDDNSGWIWDDHNNIPKKVIDSVKFVDAAETLISFVKMDGTVWSCGLNNDGNFGAGYTYGNYTDSPVKMKGINNAVRVAVSTYVTTVLLSSGEVYVTGRNIRGQLGADSIPVTTIINEPIKINNLSKIVDIKSHTAGTIALDSSGNVWYWGDQNITGIPSFEPKMKSGLTDIVAISASCDGSHFFALDSKKNCYAWGACGWGQCSTSYSDIITPVLVATHVEDIMAGETFSYIARSDGSIWASGQSLHTIPIANNSIWLDQTDIYRKYFTKINPTLPEFGLCKPINIVDTVEIIDSIPIVNESFVIMPNAFTPNGDNINDIIKPIIKPSSQISNYTLNICNRWGEIVFSTTDITNGWNGDFKEKKCDNGVYFYLILYDQNNKKQSLKGDITLLR